MGWVILGIILLAVMAIMPGKLTKKTPATPKGYPYQKIEALFSPAERSFLGVLQQAAGDQAMVLGKVRVADVIKPTKGLSRGEWQKAFNKISAKHFDFILCDPANLKVLCAIELDDKSHLAAKRIKRDAFLQGACTAAGMPLLQVPAKASYVITDIQRLIAPYLKQQVPTTAEKTPKLVEPTPEPSKSPALHGTTEEERSCPKCSSQLVMRRAKKGKSIGDRFWACSSFPQCRYTEKAEHVDTLVAER